MVDEDLADPIRTVRDDLVMRDLVACTFERLADDPAALVVHGRTSIARRNHHGFQMNVAAGAPMMLMNGHALNILCANVSRETVKHSHKFFAEGGISPSNPSRSARQGSEVALEALKG